MSNIVYAEPRDFRKEAEAHWKYTSELLELAGTDANELLHFLYVEAMVHGYKHAIEEVKSIEPMVRPVENPVSYPKPHPDCAPIFPGQNPFRGKIQKQPSNANHCVEKGKE